MLDDQKETHRRVRAGYKQSAPEPLLLLLLLLPAFASRLHLQLLVSAASEPCLSLSPAVELEWLVRVFGGFREFNVAFFQKPLNCPVDHHHRKSVVLVHYIPLHRITDLSFYSLLVASSLISESIGPLAWTMRLSFH